MAIYFCNCLFGSLLLQGNCSIFVSLYIASLCFFHLLFFLSILTPAYSRCLGGASLKSGVASQWVDWGGVEPNRLTDEVMRPWWRRRPQHNEADGDCDGNGNGNGRQLGFVVGGVVLKGAMCWQMRALKPAGTTKALKPGTTKALQRCPTHWSLFDEWGDKESLVVTQQGGRTKDLFFQNPSHGSLVQKNKVPSGIFLGGIYRRVKKEEKTVLDWLKSPSFKKGVFKF